MKKKKKKKVKETYMIKKKRFVFVGDGRPEVQKNTPLLQKPSATNCEIAQNCPKCL